MSPEPKEVLTWGEVKQQTLYVLIIVEFVALITYDITVGHCQSSMLNFTTLKKHGKLLAQTLFLFLNDAFMIRLSIAHFFCLLVCKTNV